MESSFATLKHNHVMKIPRSFDSVKTAKAWVDKFYAWYNSEHLHSGINFITPNECHEGKGPEIMKARNEIIAQMRLPNGEPVKRDPQEMPKMVSLMTFGRKVKKTERAVKAHEYKIGSKAAA